VTALTLCSGLQIVAGKISKPSITLVLQTSFLFLSPPPSLLNQFSFNCPENSFFFCPQYLVLFPFMYFSVDERRRKLKD
jgi:hypothetical protein